MLQAHVAIETNLFREGAFLAEVRHRQAAGLGPDLMLLPGSTASAMVEADLARGLVSLWISSSGPGAGAQQHLPAAGTGPCQSGLAQGQVEADPGGKGLGPPTGRAPIETVAARIGGCMRTPTRVRTRSSLTFCI